MKPSIAIVVASTDSERDPRPSLSRFAEEVAGRGEVLLVDASRDGCIAASSATLRNVRTLKRTPGMLAPELWRDGLRATDADFVAFSTTAMIPEPSWLDAMLGRLAATGAAGVGGPIMPSSALRPTDRAIYLLRYVNYYKPSLLNPEPPGDNAVYRRDRLEKHRDLVDRGFWEVEIHHALRHQGERLAMAEHARVIYQGGSRLLPSLRQRLQHAAIHGASRGARMSTMERALRTALFPIVPALMLRRIASSVNANQMAVMPWVPALPALALLSASWAFGEALGYGMGIDPLSKMVSRESRTEEEAQGAANPLVTPHS